MLPICALYSWLHNVTKGTFYSSGRHVKFRRRQCLELRQKKRNRRERVSDFKWSSLSRGIFNARHLMLNICSLPFPAIQPQNECYTECNYADYLVLENEQQPDVKGSRQNWGLLRESIARKFQGGVLKRNAPSGHKEKEQCRN